MNVLTEPTDPAIDKSKCPKPVIGVHTRRRGNTFYIHDANRDEAYRLNGTAGVLWMMFNR